MLRVFREFSILGIFQRPPKSCTITVFCVFQSFWTLKHPKFSQKNPLRTISSILSPSTFFHFFKKYFAHRQHWETLRVFRKFMILDYFSSALQIVHILENFEFWSMILLNQTAMGHSIQRNLGFIGGRNKIFSQKSNCFGMATARN